MTGNGSTAGWTDADSPFPGNGHVQPIEWVWAKDTTLDLDTPSLVSDLLENQQLSLMFGTRGCGKTFLALDLCLHLANGFTWFDRETTQSAVVYLALEAGRSINRRIWAWLNHRNLIGVDIPFAYIPTPLDFTGEVDISRLISTIAHNCPIAWPPKLIAIDTVSRALAGGDENSPQDAGIYVKNCGRLQSELGCAILSVAHSGYSNKDRVRGHSALPFAIDTELAVKRDEDSKICTATVTRQRDGLDGSQFHFALRQVELGRDRRDRPVTTCLVEPVDEQDAPVERKSKTGRKLADHQMRALNVLGLALAKMPETPVNPNIPPGTVCVSRDLWRRYLIDAGVIRADHPGTERTLFKRLVDRLVVEKCIGVWQDWVWPL